MPEQPPDYRALEQAYLSTLVEMPVEYSGLFMGIPFTKHKDGTYTWGGVTYRPNFLYEKRDARSE